MVRFLKRNHFLTRRSRGRATAFLGPAVVAAVTTLGDSQRLGIATILLFLGTGLVLLTGMREPRSERVDRAAVTD